MVEGGFSWLGDGGNGAEKSMISLISQMVPSLRGEKRKGDGGGLAARGEIGGIEHPSPPVSHMDAHKPGHAENQAVPEFFRGK